MKKMQTPALAATSKPGAISKQSQCKPTTRGQQTHWLDALTMLAWRFDSLGFTPDLAAMSLVQLRDQYLWLKGMA